MKPSQKEGFYGSIIRHNFTFGGLPFARTALHIFFHPDFYSATVWWVICSEIYSFVVISHITNTASGSLSCTTTVITPFVPLFPTVLHASIEFKAFLD